MTSTATLEIEDYDNYLNWIEIKISDNGNEFSFCSHEVEIDEWKSLMINTSYTLCDEKAGTIMRNGDKVTFNHEYSGDYTLYWTYTTSIDVCMAAFQQACDLLGNCNCINLRTYHNS